MKPTEQQIEDCRVQGIVPGAVIACARRGGEVIGIVLPYDQWNNLEEYGYVSVNDVGAYGLCAIHKDSYATVLTPALTLTPGMACLIPSPVGRQFVKELAEEKGMWLGSQTVENGAYQSIYMVDDGYHNGKMVAGTSYDAGIRTMTPLHEFIRMLMEYTPPAPPKTTEERLKEAVDVMHIAELGLKTAVQKEKSCQMIGTITPKWALENVEAFLESIKP